MIAADTNNTDNDNINEAPSRVECPACLGAKNSMQFRAGDRSHTRCDRALGIQAGWKAEPCPECAGQGDVLAADAPAIEEKLRLSMQAAREAADAAALPRSSRTQPR